MEKQTILVTGAAGFIGAHVLVALADAGFDCVPLDNLSNGSPGAIAKAGVVADKPLLDDFARIDIRDRDALAALLGRRPVKGVVHLAGLKSVSESIADPLAYYDNNVGGTLVLLEELRKAGVCLFIFSSSATVYSPEGTPPFVEDSRLGPTNPYGRTKLQIEQMLDDLQASDSSWKLAKLRYFNPVGAHPSGAIGEDPRGLPNNLMPLVCDAASGRLDKLRIFGSDYPTPDGTGIRDFIHVMDLAEGHVAALKKLDSSPAGTSLTVNLGTGRGTSVTDLVETFERVNEVKVPREYAGRRPGDVAVSYADCTLAASRLGWVAKRTLDDMCRDAWKWRFKNPSGYDDSR